jgi:hypothetical protein
MNWFQYGSRFRLLSSLIIGLISILLLFDGTHQRVLAIHLTTGLTLKGGQGIISAMTIDSSHSIINMI